MSREFTMPEFQSFMRVQEAPQAPPPPPLPSLAPLQPLSHHYFYLTLPPPQQLREGHEVPSHISEAHGFTSDRSDSAAGTSAGRRGPRGSVSRRPSASLGSGSGSFLDDDDCCESRSSQASTSTSTKPRKKQNHSEIEKRRRDKMNMYIAELSSMIPMCSAMARRLDKLSALRLAVAHLRNVRGALACNQPDGGAGAGIADGAEAHPALFHARDLNQVLVHSAAGAESFVVVVGCDRGRLLYLSHSVTRLLEYEAADLLGQSMFDILHPKDVAKVKEQLSSSDLSPRDRFIDAKTMLPLRAEVSASARRLCPGARRSFLCRVKCKPPAAPGPDLQDTQTRPETGPASVRKYCVLQCTGYLKSWAPAEMESGAEEEELGATSCLVAVARALPVATAPPAPRPPARPISYYSRHSIDGKFLFVEQRVTLALGFLPQELLGTSLYEYVCEGEGVARAHKQALVDCQPRHTPVYQVRTKDRATAHLQTHFKPFRNPWTKELESLYAHNCVVSAVPVPEQPAPPPAPALAPVPVPAPAPLPAPRYEMCTLPEEWSTYVRGERGPGAGRGGEVQRLIESQVESHKIGNAIAEAALRHSSPPPPPPTPPPAPAPYSPLPADLMHDVIFNPLSMVDNILGTEGEGAASSRNNVPQSAAPSPESEAATETEAAVAVGDGNGEAAMAVIMSLLEADAGLGGPVSFSNMPWPLP